MLPVRQREMERLFSRDEAAGGSLWPVARYYICRDVIYLKVDLSCLTHPDPEAWEIPDLEIWGLVDECTPLAERDAFLSFARLAQRGEPSEDAILDWVHKYGLLRRLDPNDSSFVLMRGSSGRGRYVLNQEPMPVEKFREEARHAYELLDLFQIVRSRDIDALRERVMSWPADLSYTPTQRLIVELLGGNNALKSRFDAEIMYDDILYWCRRAVELLIQPEIAEMKHVFRPNGKLGLICPDLHTALYWQFACLVEGKRPTDFCEGCGNIFTKRRRNHKCCDSTCRSRKARK